MDTEKAIRELEEKLNETIKDIRRQKIISIIFFFISGAFFLSMAFFLVAYFINLGTGREFILGIFALIFFSILIVTLGVAILERIIVRSLNQKVTILTNAIDNIKDKKPWRSEPLNIEEVEEIEVNEINDVMKK